MFEARVDGARKQQTSSASKVRRGEGVRFVTSKYLGMAQEKREQHCMIRSKVVNRLAASSAEIQL